MIESILQWLQNAAAAVTALATALSMQGAEPPMSGRPAEEEIRLRQQMERTDDLQTYITLGTRLELERIDLERFHVTAEEVDELYEQMILEGQLPWYLDLYWSNQTDEDGTTIWICPEYLDPVEYNRKRYERAVRKVLEETVYPGMTELQIALSIHDYLAVHCHYDEALTLYTEYDVLVGGSAVCQGYAEAYMDLLNRAGVACILVESQEMNHCWNQVKIGETWYHVDVTWDDPTPDQVGMASHGVFLISDETMRTEEYGYYGWDSPNICPDSSYESGWFWEDSISPVVYADANTCYLIRIGESSYSILRRDEAAGEETRLARMDFKYPDPIFKGSRRFHFYTTGLTKIGGALYYTDVHQVRRLDLITGEVSAVYEHDVSATRRVLVGSFIDDGILYLCSMDKEQNMTYEEVPFEEG